MQLDSLTEQEQKLIELFFLVNPSWKPIIALQVATAKVSRSNSVSSYFVNFEVDTNTKRISTCMRVPAEIIVGRFDIPSDRIVGQANKIQLISPCSFAVLDDYAFGIRLHFADGFLVEMEIYSLAGTKLDVSRLTEQQIVCVVYEKTMENLVNEVSS